MAAAGMPDGQELPPEMQSVPLRVLEAYVRERIVRFLEEPTFSRALSVPNAAVQRAMNATFQARAAASAAQQASGRFLQLVFRHACQSQGCLEPGCELCAHNPSRRCSDNFSGKYLSGDGLLARCGAPIRLEVIDRVTGDAVHDDSLASIQLEMCILDGRMYDEMGVGHDGDGLDAAALLTNNSGRPLLVSGKGAANSAAGHVLVPLEGGVAYLPDLSVTGSSEAILQGQKPPFRLMARAVNAADGTRATHIRPAISEAFVVATPRVRTAVKADIPHVDDHVSKLHSVGAQTQSKLLDVSAACEAAGVSGVKLPHNCVERVGEFRALVEVAERDRALCDTLKRVLKLSKGWEAARDHARSAVETDNRLRRWLPGPGPQGPPAGLLYRCTLGNIDLASPLGLLQPSREASMGMMECTLTQHQTDAQADLMRQLADRAAQCWWQPGHPGFAIAPLDSDRFLASLQGTPGPFAVPIGSPLLATAAPIVSGEANLRTPSIASVGAHTPRPSPGNTPPLSPRDPQYGSGDFPRAGSPEYAMHMVQQQAAAQAAQDQLAAVAAVQQSGLAGLQAQQQQQQQQALMAAQAAQMAAEGGPPTGVGRTSLDSAFGSAQRALQLSTLSMPERIAYMRRERELQDQAQQVAFQRQRQLAAQHEAAANGFQLSPSAMQASSNVARAWQFAQTAHMAAPGSGFGGSVGRQSAPAASFQGQNLSPPDPQVPVPHRGGLSTNSSPGLHLYSGQAGRMPSIPGHASLGGGGSGINLAGLGGGSGPLPAWALAAQHAQGDSAADFMGGTNAAAMLAAHPGAAATAMDAMLGARGGGGGGGALHVDDADEHPAGSKHGRNGRKRRSTSSAAVPQSPFAAASFPHSGGGGSSGVSPTGNSPRAKVPTPNPREPSLAHEVSFAGSYPTGPQPSGTGGTPGSLPSIGLGPVSGPLAVTASGAELSLPLQGSDMEMMEQISNDLSHGTGADPHLRSSGLGQVLAEAEVASHAAAQAAAAAATPPHSPHHMLSSPHQMPASPYAMPASPHQLQQQQQLQQQAAQQQPSGDYSGSIAGSMQQQQQQLGATGVSTGNGMAHMPSMDAPGMGSMDAAALLQTLPVAGGAAQQPQQQQMSPVPPQANDPTNSYSNSVDTGPNSVGWGGDDTAGVTAALPTRMSGLSMDQSQYEEQLAALSYGSTAGGDAAADTGAALPALQQLGSPLQLPPPQ